MKVVLKTLGANIAMVIPAEVVRDSGLAAGQEVEIEAQDGQFVAKLLKTKRLTLSERLALFDSTLHGGEFSSSVK